MNSKKEKLGILSDMIAFAKTDSVIKDIEYDFLLSVSEHLGVDKADFDLLFNTKVEKPILKSQAERILHFHRLVLLMNVDTEQHLAETNELRTIGLKMGLPPIAIEQVLVVMHKYPNKVIPPNVLIDIFKTYDN